MSIRMPLCLLISIIVLIFSACKKDAFTNVSGVVKDALTDEPIKYIRLYMDTGCSDWSRCNGETAARTDSSGVFNMSLETNCNPSLELRRNGSGVNVFVFYDKKRDENIRKQACSSVNSAKLKHDRDYVMEVLRYPGLDLWYESPPEGKKKASIKKIEISGLAEGHADIEDAEFYPVADSIATLNITITYKGGDVVFDTLNYHHLNNFRYKAKLYK